jgi:hypothetical protein
VHACARSARWVWVGKPLGVGVQGVHGWAWSTGCAFVLVQVGGWEVEVLGK